MATFVGRPNRIRETREISRLGRTPSELAESLLWPNRKVAKEYQPVKIATNEGAFLSGYVSESDSSDRELALRDPATQKVTKVSR